MDFQTIIPSRMCNAVKLSIFLGVPLWLGDLVAGKNPAYKGLKHYPSTDGQKEEKINLLIDRLIHSK